MMIPADKPSTARAAAVLGECESKCGAANAAELILRAGRGSDLPTCGCRTRYLGGTMSQQQTKTVCLARRERKPSRGGSLIERAIIRHVADRDRHRATA
jgi:hypothetical protein